MNPIDTAKMTVSHHANEVMRKRRVTWKDIVDVVRNPEITEPHQDCRRYIKGELVAVVADDGDGATTLVTVLWRRRDTWTTHEMARRGATA